MWRSRTYRRSEAYHPRIGRMQSQLNTSPTPRVIKYPAIDYYFSPHLLVVYIAMQKVSCCDFICGFQWSVVLSELLLYFYIVLSSDRQINPNPTSASTTAASQRRDITILLGIRNRSQASVYEGKSFRNSSTPHGDGWREFAV